MSTAVENGKSLSVVVSGFNGFKNLKISPHTNRRTIEIKRIRKAKARKRAKSKQKYAPDLVHNLKHIPDS